MADQPRKFARGDGGGRGRGGAGYRDTSGIGGGASSSAGERGSSAVTSNVFDGEEPATNALLWLRYTVTSDKLGKGAQGTAYFAIDTETEELLAVKKVDPSPNRKYERCIHWVREECRILKTLDHENVIRIKNHGFGFGDERHSYFVFMELASGGQLLYRVPTGTGLSQSRAKGFLRQLLAGVAHCQSPEAR